MKNILLCYGNGGHKAQALRIFGRLGDKYSDLRFFTITDEGSAPSFSAGHMEVGETRNKDTGLLQSPIKVIKNIYYINSFVRKNNVTSIISTGPGVSVLVFIATLFRVKKFIHFETWSKFEKITITTRILKNLSCIILYQNEELKDFLPNGKFVGRL